MAGETVLAVDDREDSLKFLRVYVLEPNGYRMIEARNGADALEITLSQKVDLIISDLDAQNGWPGVAGKLAGKRVGYASHFNDLSWIRGNGGAGFQVGRA